MGTARGLLMLSLRLRLSPATAMAATGVAAMDTTARGLLMLSPRLMLLLRLAVAMAVDTDTARGLLSPAMATGATVVTVVVMAAMAMAAGTMVSYHRIRRSELSQKQNHKNSH